jgi:hypothetical protein
MTTVRFGDQFADDDRRQAPAAGSTYPVCPECGSDEYPVGLPSWIPGKPFDICSFCVTKDLDAAYARVTGDPITIRTPYRNGPPYTVMKYNPDGLYPRITGKRPGYWRPCSVHEPCAEPYLDHRPAGGEPGTWHSKRSGHVCGPNSWHYFAETEKDAFHRRLDKKVAAAADAPTLCDCTHCVNARIPTEDGSAEFYREAVRRVKDGTLTRSNDSFITQNRQILVVSSDKFPLLADDEGELAVLADRKPEPPPLYPGYDGELIVTVTRDGKKRRRLPPEEDALPHMSPEDRLEGLLVYLEDMQARNKGSSGDSWAEYFNKNVTPRYGYHLIQAATGRKDFREARDRGLIAVLKPGEKHRKGQSWSWVLPVYAVLPPDPVPEPEEWADDQLREFALLVAEEKLAGAVPVEPVQVSRNTVVFRRTDETSYRKADQVHPRPAKPARRPRARPGGNHALAPDVLRRPDLH